MADKKNNNNNTMIGEKAMHVHIECSRGISAYCVLEAALGIASELSLQDKWIDEIEEFLPRIFPGLLTNCYLREQHSADVAKDNINFVPRSIPVYIKALETAERGAGGLLLPPWVRQQVKAVLHELVDDKRPEKADPASFTIGHIVAALWCLDRLGVRSATCSPLAWSSAVGLMPIPAQRLVRRQLFVGMPTVLDTDSSYTKRTTGDGLALLRVLTGIAYDKTRPIQREPPPMVLRASASGQDDGSGDDLIQIGLSLGELLRNDDQNPLEVPHLWKVDYGMRVLECNIDDGTPEHLAYCVDILLHQGAADVWITPIVMKKGRAAHTLHCLCRLENVEHLLSLVFKHTSTIGVRVQTIDRVALRRKLLAVETEWSKEQRVNVKVAYLGEDAVSIKAEFDHCQAIALQTQVPIQQVTKQAEYRAQSHLEMERRKKSQQQASPTASSHASPSTTQGGAAPSALPPASS